MRVTATVVFPGPARAAFASRFARDSFVAAALGILFQAPAEAQLAASVAIDSDYRLRGYSLTDGQPAASAIVTYDHRSGLYFSLSALQKLGHDPRFLGVIANAGYAKRLNETVTFDAGLLRSQIRSAAPDQYGYEYTELYAGGYVGPVTGRVYYSPDYRQLGQSTLYGELEAGIEPARNWRLSGHVGMLTYLNSGYAHRRGHTEADWRIGVAREFGNLEIHSALSDGGTSQDYHTYKKVTATVGASLSF